jgi:hypothetical protein
VKVYFDFNDWWVGVYRGPHHWYICPLPCLVFRFGNKQTRRNLARAKAGWPDGIPLAAALTQEEL